MKGIKTVHALGVGALLGSATITTAQAGSATIYRDPGFSGPAVTVDRGNSNLGLRFQIFSIRVNGGAWELCPQTNFRGSCLVVRQSTADLRRAYGWAGPLQSMRPAGVPPVAPPVGGGQMSLRGMASEFFPAPRTGNRPGAGRVEACPRGNATAACASQAADSFCRSVGWNGSARELMETVNRRFYLADVLCVRSGF
jgi:hypothetical protein